MLKKLDDSTKLLLIGIIFLVMILYILVTAIGSNDKKDYQIISKFLNTMGNNYSLKISSGEVSISYSRDNDIEVFESENFTNKKYVRYDGKTYLYGIGKLKEAEPNNDLNDKYYYDMELIKKVFNYCKYSNAISGIVKCKITNSNYNNELQSLYGISRQNDKDIVINFFYSGKNVKRIMIDYDDEKYDIQIISLNKNDYKEILSSIK